MSEREPTPPAVGAYAARTKYDEPGRAARYAKRSARRHAEEWRLLAGLLDRLSVRREGRALDVPCGAGRVASELLGRGHAVRCADLSAAMRAETARALFARRGFLGVDELDLEAPPEPGAARYDLVVCFRFLHHLPDAAARARVLRALAARTADDGLLVLSFHHPVSAHAFARAIRRVVTRRRGDRHAIAVGRLRREAADAGLSLVATAALRPFVRELWLAAFRRVRAGGERS